FIDVAGRLALARGFLGGSEQAIDERFITGPAAGFHCLEFNPFDCAEANIAWRPIVSTVEHFNVMSDSRLLEQAIQPLHLGIVEVLGPDSSVINIAKRRRWIHTLDEPRAASDDAGNMTR